MGQRRFFTGDTVDQAVLEAAGYYGVSPESIAYEELEKRHGFVKRRRKVVIKVDPEAPTRGEATAEPEHEGNGGPRGAEPEPRSKPEESPAAEQAGSPPAPPAPIAEREERPVEESPAPRRGGAAADAETEPRIEAEAPRERAPESEEPAAPVERTEAEREELSERVFRAMDDILELSDLHVEPEVRIDGADAKVDLVGPERDRLEEDEGELLVAFETVLSRIVWRWDVGLENVRVDSDGFRDRREEELRRSAGEMARRVRESGESSVMEPLPPSERRIVHLALSDTGGVTTESEGDGYMKRVRIRPD